MNGDAQPGCKRGDGEGVWERQEGEVGAGGGWGPAGEVRAAEGALGEQRGSKLCGAVEVEGCCLKRKDEGLGMGKPGSWQVVGDCQ